MVGAMISSTHFPCVPPMHPARAPYPTFTAFLEQEPVARPTTGVARFIYAKQSSCMEPVAGKREQGKGILFCLLIKVQVSDGNT